MKIPHKTSKLNKTTKQENVIEQLFYNCEWQLSPEHKREAVYFGMLKLAVAEWNDEAALVWQTHSWFMSYLTELFISLNSR